MLTKHLLKTITECVRSGLGTYTINCYISSESQVRSPANNLAPIKSIFVVCFQ